PALHPHPDFEAGRAFDEDGPVRHPRATSPVSCPDLSAGVPTNPYQAARHLGADPVRGVSRDVDRASLHVRPEVHAGVAVDGDASSSHAPANPLDLSRITVDLHLVAGLSLDREEAVEPRLPLSQVDG